MAEHATVTITKLSAHGEGIAVTSNAEIYVPHALVGEKLELELGEPFAAGSKRCPGKVIKVLTPSADREEHIPCPHYADCGGCQLMHLKYEAQLKNKQQDIIQAVSKAWDKLSPALKAQGQLELTDLTSKVQPVLGMAQLEFQVSRFKSIRYFAQVDGRLQSGFFAPRSHRLVPIHQCCLEPERFGVIAQQMTQVLEQAGAQAFAGQDTTGQTAQTAAPLVKALVLRAGDAQEILACLIVANQLPSELKAKLQALAQELGLTSLYIGLNPSQGNALFTDQLELVHGEPYITKTLLGQHFKVGPNTFLQVNYEICEQLYTAVVEHCAAAAPTALAAPAATAAGAGGAGADQAEQAAQAEQAEQGAGVALDLCCGVGTMSLALARHFKHVIGVEIVESAVAAACDNAQSNGLGERAQFIAGDLSKVLPSLIKPYDQQRVLAVIADPARVGIGEENARLLSKIKGPCRMALVYCALNALQRELPVLLKGGFKVDKIQGYDMFPHTSHVETVVFLSK